MKQLIILLLLFCTTFNLIAQTDCKDCKDYPTFPRMPDYYIKNYKEIEFDSEKFYYDKTSHVIEGKKFEISYFHNSYADSEFKFPSRLQILRNYSNAIERAGGKILFERHNAEHGYYSFKVNGKEVYMKISPRSSGKSYMIKVIERDEMRQDIVINADLIKQKIDIYGKVAIYGIQFDVGKSTIRSESTPALVQIAEFLNTNPSVNCWVVGHTDADGSFEINSKLSLARATAIKNELESKYNIATTRLFAEGVGPLAPVATNQTEEGKQLNRRVELVLK